MLLKMTIFCAFLFLKNIFLKRMYKLFTIFLQWESVIVESTVIMAESDLTVFIPAACIPFTLSLNSHSEQVKHWMTFSRATVVNTDLQCWGEQHWGWKHWTSCSVCLRTLIQTSAWTDSQGHRGEICRTPGNTRQHNTCPCLCVYHATSGHTTVRTRVWEVNSQRRDTNNTEFKQAEQ